MNTCDFDDMVFTPPITIGIILFGSSFYSVLIFLGGHMTAIPYRSKSPERLNLFAVTVCSPYN